MNPGEIPKPVNEAAFTMAGHQSSQMTVSAKERSKFKGGKGKEAGTYYVCLYPHMTSTYSIVVNEASADADY